MPPARFSLQAKGELARLIPDNPCCQWAELAGLVHAEGRWTADDPPALDLVLSNAAAARKVVLLLRRVIKEHGEIALQQRRGPQNKLVYVVRIPAASGAGRIWRVLANLHAANRGKGLEGELLRRRCCRRSYIRGAFLGRGSLSDPHRQYHFEIGAQDPFRLGILRACVDSLGVTPKVASRKGGWVLYLKDADQIPELLLHMGAHQAILDIEDTKIRKGMRNRINRLVNCETANVDKTVAAAMKQVEDILLLDQELGLNSLPTGLRALAKLRVQHPYASLGELGEILEPPLSKSGVNHRIRRLSRMADQLRKKQAQARPGGETHG